MENLPWPRMLPHQDYLLYISDAMDTIRQYPIEKLYPVLAAYAQKHRLNLVVTARKPQPALSAQPGLIDLTGHTTLLELYQIIAHAKIVVGNETGSTHLAWILGKPTVMIYGGGHYGFFRPAKNCRLLYHLMACYGCSWDTCPYWRKQVAPCILGVTTTQVEEALAQIAQGKESTEQDFE